MKVILGLRGLAGNFSMDLSTKTGETEIGLFSAIQHNYGKKSLEDLQMIRKLFSSNWTVNIK